MRHIESQHQQSLIKWWDLQCSRWDAHHFELYANPNGGKRDKREAARLKAEGVRPGVSDLFLAIPAGEYHGLYIELKAPGGKATMLQNQFIRRARARGYRAEVCVEWLTARDLIVEYLEAT